MLAREVFDDFQNGLLPRSRLAVHLPLPPFLGYPATAKSVETLPPAGNANSALAYLSTALSQMQTPVRKFLDSPGGRR